MFCWSTQPCARTGMEAGITHGKILSHARVSWVFMGWNFTRTQKLNKSLTLGGAGRWGGMGKCCWYCCHSPQTPHHGAVRGQAFISSACVTSGRQNILTILLKTSTFSYAHPVSWSTHGRTPGASSQGPERLRAIRGFASASENLFPANSSWSMPAGRWQTHRCFSRVQNCTGLCIFSCNWVHVNKY